MEKRINVIFMGNFLYPHGMAEAKRIQHFIDYLNANSVSVGVLLLRQGKAKLRKSEMKGIHNGVPFKTIGNDLRVNLILPVRLLFYVFNGMLTLVSWKKKKSKNILYCYNGLNIENILFVIFARLLGYFIVFDIVENFALLNEKLHMLSRFKHYTWKILDKYVVNFADGIVVISKYLLNLYNRRSGCEVPLELIPVSAALNRHDGKQGFGRPIKIVYSGSFAEKDGVELLIEAFESLKVSADVVLLLAGKGHRLPLIRKRLEGTQNIKYIGYLDDSAFYDFLREADILCITRVGSMFANAGFPYKLGEYLATGNPVVVSDVSDVSYYLENMKDAIIVESDSPEQIRKALEYCIRNPEVAMKIGASGREKCEKYFDPARNGQRLLELLQALQ